MTAQRRRGPGGNPEPRKSHHTAAVGRDQDIPCDETPRVPPHDLQAEESLLGAMLLRREAIQTTVEVCGPDDFYKPAHGHIFEAICTLYAQGEPADAVTVADELRRAGVLEAVGGAATLISLQANTPATSNAHRYAQSWLVRVPGGVGFPWHTRSSRPATARTTQRHPWPWPT